MSKVAIKNEGLSATYSPTWLLTDSEYPPTGSHFEYLINGQAAFGRLYEEISKAKTSIDIAIWGFQPSMFFKRDGESLCIGELLAKKAYEGVEVRVLVWTMALHLQTFTEDTTNLGASKYASKKITGTTTTQREYDEAWYYAVGFDKAIYPSERMKLGVSLQKTMCTHINKLFNNKEKLKNLSFETRKVKRQSNNYVDKELSLFTKKTLNNTASHHQKTVLIDYYFSSKYKPTDISPRGFILEHNMLDTYWSTNNHSIKTTAPNKGKNVATPLQDHSSFLKGPILHHINHNFCQSWNREVKGDLLKERSTSLTTHRARFKVDQPIAIQALRTYDSPHKEDIKRLYLKNISKTTSYIYTENQYFRWPPLVDAFKKHWQNLRKSGRNVEPIYWFVVTNSSDTGLGAGTVNTDRMFKALGRRDVLPNVAIEQDYNLKQDYNKKIGQLKKDAAALPNRAMSKKQIQELPEKKENAKQQLPKATEDYYKSLKKDLSKEIGLKTHICVLHAMDSNPKKWQEIYIHSKVTMINDTFLTMGSANINTRSMQVDTEMNLALEHGETVKRMRKAIWWLNTKNKDAVPDAMHLNSVAKATFEAWGKLLKKNSDRKKAGQSPLQPLTEFLRLSPSIKDFD